jgi:catechol 2,3-dioxygenase-like lactoylglutathione lyase family enzyme
MIHHVSVGTRDIERARRFYQPVMTLLGFRLLKDDPDQLHYGVGEIMFSVQMPKDGEAAHPGNGIHFAFQARDRAMVGEFHRLALANGGTDDGGPAPRPHYDRHYYAAFVRDPDGNKIEAVTYSAD